MTCEFKSESPDSFELNETEISEVESASETIKNNVCSKVVKDKVCKVCSNFSNVVESPGEEIETVNNSVFPKVILNRMCPGTENRVCPKVINKSFEDKVIECKSEVGSEDECTVSENKRNVSIVEFFCENEGNILEDELNNMTKESHVTSISKDECQITRNEGSLGSTDDCHRELDNCLVTLVRMLLKMIATLLTRKGALTLVARPQSVTTYVR